MRLLGRFTDANEAKLARGLLVSRQIDCRLEPAGSAWEIWALNEDQMLEARTLFQQFLADPLKEQYAPLAQQAEAAIAADTAREKAAEAASRRRRRRAVINTVEFAARPAPLTWALIGVCSALWILQTISPDTILPWLYDTLKITPLGDDSLDAVLNGQVWRLFTPVLLHATIDAPGGLGILHIFFNMLWLKDLGGIIERRHNSLYFLGLIMTLAGFSSLLQFFLYGPNFVGLSGVVYGLLGFLWIRGKLDPRYGLKLNSAIVWFMLIWLGMCFMTSGVANGAHVGGLALGMLWGAVSGALANFADKDE